jgi:hypothetical protein
MQRDATLSFDQVRENDIFGMHSDAASFIQAAEFQIDGYLGVLHARFRKLLWQLFSPNISLLIQTTWSPVKTAISWQQYDEMQDLIIYFSYPLIKL